MTVSSAGKPQAPSSPLFEIKSAQLPMVALLLKSEHWSDVARQLLEQFGPGSESPDFFEHEPVVLDLSALAADTPYDDPAPLLSAMRQCQLQPVAFRGEPAAYARPLVQAGLVAADMEIQRSRPEPAATPAPPTAPAPEVVREVPGPATLVIDKPLRSGQKVYARGGDLVVLAMVNQGAEVVADGNIHVYAPLRGKAMAGARGNTQARIFSLCLEPELVSIAGVYRTSENPFPEAVAGKPAQIRLSADGQDRLLFDALGH